MFPTCRGRHVTIKAPISQPLSCGMLFKRAKVELRAYPKSSAARKVIQAHAKWSNAR